MTLKLTGKKTLKKTARRDESEQTNIQLEKLEYESTRYEQIYSLYSLFNFNQSALTKG